MNHIEIARICHQANKAYCEALGDRTQLDWENASDWQRESAVRGVAYALNNPGATPESQHEAWRQDKLAAGWTLGPVKNPELKQHPCLVPYDQLPIEQRRKDALFQAIARALC